MMSPYLKTDKTRVQSPVVCNKRIGLRLIRGHQIGPTYKIFVFTFSRILACKDH